MSETDNVTRIRARTVPGGTFTSEGFIKHATCNGFHAPVAVIIDTDRTVSPVRQAGHYVYALPGGGRLCPGARA